MCLLLSTAGGLFDSPIDVPKPPPDPMLPPDYPRRRRAQRVRVYRATVDKFDRRCQYDRGD